MKYYNFFNKKIFLALAVVALLGFARGADAAILFFEMPDKRVQEGDEVRVTLRLDIEKDAVNAVEGTIVFGDNLTPVEIGEQGSFVSLWLERPVIEGNAVRFSGVIPAGYFGDQSQDWSGGRPGRIVSVVLKAEKAGPALIEVQDPAVLLHDGKGSHAEVNIPHLIFQVEPRTTSFIADQSLPDTEPPEDFTPTIVKDENLFDGKYVAIFASQDKNSGIDRYEIAERRSSVGTRYDKLKWKKAESPHILGDQNLKSYVYVKAVDRKGNERIAVIVPQAKILWYENTAVWIIMVIVVVAGIFWGARRIIKLKNNGHA